jgi:hypothetical protein
MVRWGLGICAVVFAVMLLIPVPLRPDRHGHADAPASQFTKHGLPNLSPVAPPRAGAALLSLPEQFAGEVPAPAMPEVANIASIPAPIIPFATLPEPAGGHTHLVPAKAVAPAKVRPEVYRVTVQRAELRAGPSIRDRGISLLSDGDRVEVLSRYADRWFFVRLADGKTEGYLDATLLSPAD